MVKYKVTIDRDQCISCMSCVALCPDIFEMNEEDGKTQIVANYRVGDNLGEGVIPENLKGCAEEAANACPVTIISIEEVQE
ncbi:MAG: ferredoxin [Thermoprotei archaeon]|nr:MAG: ferredoxin [Thermoprotei archaeon]RLE75708.1 MAG: ferredoxin [Thermoprotei archaeon]